MQIKDLRPAREQSGIYAIINIANDKHYIGSAINFKNRLKWHIKDLKRNCHRNSRLQNSWNKNWDFNFIFVILEYCKSEKLIDREQWWIDNLKPEYNIAPKAKNSLGIKRSEETKLKQRNLKLGTKQSREHIEARRKGLIGHLTSDKVKETTRKRSIGNKFALGYKHTEEAKRKISLSKKGKSKKLLMLLNELNEIIL